MKKYDTDTLATLRNPWSFSLKAKNSQTTQFLLFPHVHVTFPVLVFHLPRWEAGLQLEWQPGHNRNLNYQVTAKNFEDFFSAQGSIIFSEFNLHNIKDDLNFNVKDMSNNVSESIIIIIKQCITLIQCQVVLQ